MDYLTLGGAAEVEYVINRSRFIGWARPVASVEAANDFVSEIRARHREATHNVYAYCVREPEYSRYSDDGEPQGTAGKPVLEVLKKEGVTDACIVVTRYFGGILLGAGGLVRAYAHSAKLAVDAAGIVQMKACAVYRLPLDYGYYDSVRKLLPAYEAETENTDFAERIYLDLRLPLEKEAAFLKAVAELSFGKILPERTGEKHDAFKI